VTPILFYSPQDPYGCFSNFSKHPVTIYGHTCDTSEHPFQAMKFHPHRPEMVQAIMKASTPTRAAEMGRDRSCPIRADWDMTCPQDLNPVLGLTVDDSRGPGLVIERVKDLIMWEVVLAKFTQHTNLRATLLGTGERPLIEDAIHDPYWGWGCSRIGINRLGKILMGVRGVLRAG
jgi:predicted NAD-dependent protein-ADP-ribosyltransferase YbiA (DUF1768 family)